MEIQLSSYLLFTNLNIVDLISFIFFHLSSSSSSSLLLQHLIEFPSIQLFFLSILIHSYFHKFIIIHFSIYLSYYYFSRRSFKHYIFQNCSCVLSAHLFVFAGFRSLFVYTYMCMCSSWHTQHRDNTLLVWKLATSRQAPRDTITHTIESCLLKSHTHTHRLTHTHCFFPLSLTLVHASQVLPGSGHVTLLPIFLWS